MNVFSMFLLYIFFFSGKPLVVVYVLVGNPILFKLNMFKPTLKSSSKQQMLQGGKSVTYDIKNSTGKNSNKTCISLIAINAHKYNLLIVINTHTYVQPINYNKRTMFIGIFHCGISVTSAISLFTTNCNQHAHIQPTNCN